MKIQYFMFVLFVWCLLVNGSSYCIAEEKKKAESVVHGVTIVAMDAPLRATIGRKVFVEVIVGNERGNKGNDNIDGNLSYNKTTNRP